MFLKIIGSKSDWRTQQRQGGKKLCLGIHYAQTPRWKAKVNITREPARGSRCFCSISINHITAPRRAGLKTQFFKISTESHIFVHRKMRQYHHRYKRMILRLNTLHYWSTSSIIVNFWDHSITLFSFFGIIRPINWKTFSPDWLCCKLWSLKLNASRKTKINLSIINIAFIIINEVNN